MEIDRPALEQQILDLKSSLKEWERQFHADHGHKAGRDDIKANPAIAARYKEYQRTQDILSGKVSSKHSPKKQKRPRPGASRPESPSKRRTSLHDTPQKHSASTLPLPIQDEDQDPNTPAVKRTLFGPTPQKDGIVLGIFDLLPTDTPSRPRIVLGELTTNNVAVTPSRPLAPQVQDSPHQYEERARGSRTPASTGKRFLLDSFVTPQKKRKIEEGAPKEEQATPFSSGRFLTPAFLRRDNFVMPAVEEEVAPPTPKVQQPWKRRSFGRSLSGMIQDMRKEQERQADEELDLLRELEDEAEMMANTDKSSTKAVPKTVAVEDSQAVMGLDRDGFVPSDVEQSSSEEEQPQQGDKPRKPWKKKGLKRQTRRVIMRPVAKKVQPNRPKSTDNDGEDMVAETQLPEDVPSDIEANADSDFEDEDAAVKPKSKATKDKAKDVPPKKNARKVKPDAHANYRALKIKNKNSKAGGRGRFGRRR